MRTALLALGIALLAGSALAQPSANRANPQTARAFVNEVAIATPAADILGRWNQRICPGVVGASPADAQTIIDRVARRADAVGLRTGEPGCAANLMIVVTPDSDRFAHDVYDHRRELLINQNGVESSSLGAAALSAFVNTPRPVRWWHVSQTVMADGRVLTDHQTAPMGASGATAAASLNDPNSAGSGDGLAGVDATRVDGTLLRRSTRQDFGYVMVIIDTTRTAGVPMASIADYVAMVSLAQLNPDLRTANYPTILNLFSEPAPGQARPSGLTAWDTAYLEGLYRTARNARSADAQEAEISRRIVRASAG